MLTLSLATTASPFRAGTPPEFVNYQGVLRDTGGAPLDGDVDMVFRFFDGETGGDEILVDRHTVADSGPVAVSNGLFAAKLGGGTISDGTGPGVYQSLMDVFRDYGDLWLRVEVDGEVLDPRVQIVSEGFALNAAQLEGRAAAEFLDTSAKTQTKIGQLVVQESDAGEYGIESFGVEGGGYFKDTDQTGYAYVGRGDEGIQGYGTLGGGYFEDLNQSGYAQVANGDVGIWGYGNLAGGYFQDPAAGGHAWVGRGSLGNPGPWRHGRRVLRGHEQLRLWLRRQRRLRRARLGQHGRRVL